MAHAQVLGHRGAKAAGAENTIESFLHAIALGADGVELDVHPTRDGALVVDHDGCPAGLGSVHAHSAEAIRRHSPAIPTLDEVLAALPRTAIVNVEVKAGPEDPAAHHPEPVADLVVDTIGRLNPSQPLIVSSFHRDTLDRIKMRSPGLRTGYLTFLGVDWANLLASVADAGHDAIHPFEGRLVGRSARAICEAAAERGLEVNVWTVNRERRIARLVAAGATGIITDHPDLARRVIDRRAREASVRPERS